MESKNIKVNSLSEETIKDFQEAIKSEFSIVLSRNEAFEVLINWVSYFDLLAKIDSRKEVQVS